MRKILSIALALSGLCIAPVEAAVQTVSVNPIQGKICRQTAVFIGGNTYMLWVCK